MSVLTPFSTPGLPILGGNAGTLVGAGLLGRLHRLGKGSRRRLHAPLRFALPFLRLPSHVRSAIGGEGGAKCVEAAVVKCRRRRRAVTFKLGVPSAGARRPLGQRLELHWNWQRFRSRRRRQMLHGRFRWRGETTPSPAPAAFEAGAATTKGPASALSASPPAAALLRPFHSAIGIDGGGGGCVVRRLLVGLRMFVPGARCLPRALPDRLPLPTLWLALVLIGDSSVILAL